MSKIDLTDNVPSAMAKMCDGNPGALVALLELYEAEPTIDPQSAFAGIGTMLSLDYLEIYGSSIHVLFKDVCGLNVRKMILLFRAHQLGFFNSERIKQLAADQLGSRVIGLEEWQELDEKVCNQLPDFAKEDVN